MQRRQRSPEELIIRKDLLSGEVFLAQLRAAGWLLQLLRATCECEPPQWALQFRRCALRVSDTAGSVPLAHAAVPTD